MKKLIALLLALLMLTGLAACSSGTPSWEKDREEDDNDVVIVDDKDDEDEDEDDITIDDEDEPSINTDGMFIPGSANLTTYKNEFIGIGAEFDYGWIVRAGEDLNSQNGISKNLTGDELIEKLNNTYVFYDLMALPAEGNPNINIAIENLPMNHAGNLTAEGYFDIIKSSLEPTLLSSGYEEVFEIKETTFTFAGRQCPGIVITGYAKNQNVCQCMLFTKAEEFMVLVTVTAVDEQSAADVLDLFFAID